MTFPKLIGQDIIKFRNHFIFQLQRNHHVCYNSACRNIQKRGIIATITAGTKQHQQHQRSQLQQQQQYRFLTIPSSGNKRRYSPSSLQLSSSSSSSGGDDRSHATTAATGLDHHHLFQQQIQELENERNELFGTNVGTGVRTPTKNREEEIISSDGNYHYNVSMKSNSFFEEQLNELEEERNQLFGKTTDDVTSTATVHHGTEEGDLQKTIHEMNREREELYNFTSEEKNAWRNVTTSTKGTSDTGGNNTNDDYGVKSHVHHIHSPELMDAINKAREAKALFEDEMMKESSFKVNEMIQEFKNSYESHADAKSNVLHGSQNSTDENNEIFTHLDKAGEEVSMVDVGDKFVSKRIAVARSTVLFPPEVMDAFHLLEDEEKGLNIKRNEVIGPKGPIFATARLAGIMGAK